MKLKSSLKKHLAKGICSQVDMDDKEKTVFSDKTNRVEIREIICDFNDNLATCQKRNRQDKTTIKKTIPIEELLTIDFEQTFAFDYYIEHAL